MSIDNSFPQIIGISVSSGSENSLKALLEKLPSEFDAALVFIINFESDKKKLDFTLINRPDLIFQEITIETVPVKGGIYFNSPDYDLVIENGHLKPIFISATYRQHPIDQFFISIANEFKDRSIVAVLSGMGSGGIHGAKCIRTVGGTVIVQNPSNAQFPEMPEAIIGAGQADRVLEIEQIIPESLKIVETISLGQLKHNAYLQSPNEKLMKVNSLLQLKIDELEAAGKELINFLYSINSPAIFLDEQLKIRRFTQALNRQVKFTPDGECFSDEHEPLTRKITTEERFALLSSTASELLQSSEPQKVVESLCQKIMNVLDCHAFFNYLVDENLGKLQLNACAGIPDQEKEKIRWLDYGIAVCGCVAREGCRIVAEKISTVSDPRTELVKSYGIKAYACHPLLAENGKVIGTLSFGTRSRETFSEDDLSLMKAITDQVAVAMDRIQRHKEIQMIAARNEAILESLTEGLIIINKDGTFMEMNPVALKLHGFSSASESLKNLDNYVEAFELLDLQGNKIPVQSWPVFKVMRGEQVQDYVVRLYIKKTETSIIVSYNGVRVYDNDGVNISIFLTMRDVTLQKLLEKQFHRERELLQTIFDSIPVMLTIYDPHDLTFSTNKYLELVTGWTASEMKKPDAMEKVYPDPQYREMVTRYVQSLQPGFKDLDMVGKNGERIETSWANIGLEDGRQVGIGIDIRERKRAEEQLKLAYGRLQTFFDQRIGGIGIVIASKSGKITMANDYFLHLLGYSREELEAGLVDWQKMTSPEWHHVDQFALTQLKEKGVSDALEKEYQRRDHTRVPVFIVGAVMPGEPGDILAFILDITDRKKAEIQLRESEERFRIMFERHGAVMLLIEPESGAIIDANLAATLFYGYTREELRNMKIQQINQLSDEQVFKERQKAVKREGYMFVFPHRLSDGQIRIVEVYSSPIVIGNRTLLFSIIHDITGRRQMEEQLNRNAEELACANRELEAFSYSVSHDLRAPLRAIKGFCDFLMEDYHDRLDERGLGYLNRIVAGVNKMDGLIGDLLSLSIISRQQMTIQEIDLSQMGAAILEEHYMRSPQRRVEFRIEPDMKARGDARLINIALTNLLGNAWRYTDKKECAMIEFGRKQVNGEMVFYIRDNGAGFSMNQAERLFKPFQRLHSDSEFCGTGIGLAIVERVISRHGGRVWGQGELGVGAEFCFRFGG